MNESMDYELCYPTCLDRQKVDSFISITNINEDDAFDYLKFHHWNLQVALNAYYENKSNKLNKKYKKRFKLLSWNIDGLDNDFITERIYLMCKIIKRTSAELIVLQEVTLDIEKIIYLELNNDFHIFMNNNYGYYCGILVRKDLTVLNDDIRIVNYPNSVMGRSLYSLKVNICGYQLELMTTHLESMSKYSNERKTQLKYCWERILSSDCSFAIVAGDLNLRDKEVIDLGGIPKGICDASLETETQYLMTWNPELNINIQRKMNSKAMKFRFDRIYYLSKIFHPVSFELIGNQEKITNDQAFVSDHWGILVEFETDT